MPPKRKAATAKKADKPEHEVKKQKLNAALKKCADDDSELPSQINVDLECPHKHLTVYIDRDEGVAYDVMLNQTVIGNNNNKFYVLQLLHDKSGFDSAGTFYTWFRWGRVGVRGQSSFETHYGLDAALKSFKQKFKDKTGNVFGNKEFEKKKGKYDWIKLDYGEKEDSTSKVDVKIKDIETIPSKLDPLVKSVVDKICDMTRIEIFLKNQLNYDAKKAPLGRITKAQVKSGFQVLSAIEKKLLANKFDSEFEDLVNQYYTKIPHDFGFRRPKLLKTMEEFKEELALLEALSDIEVTNEAMKKEDDSDPMNPSDRNYQKLKCELTPIDKKSATYKMIESYLKNTHGETHYLKIKLHDVFEIDRQNEGTNYSNYSKKIPNKNLLWHGSGLANWFGILSQGLRIAPPEAPVSGYMFGKGVYFADCVSKSANYCRATNGQKCFMTLAEVALGNTRKLKNSDYDASNLPSGFHSTHGLGQQAPDEKAKKKIKLENNEVVVPMGKIVDCKDKDDLCLCYNEFIGTFLLSKPIDIAF